jgi:hypothetical protein
MGSPESLATRSRNVVMMCGGARKAGQCSSFTGAKAPLSQADKRGPKGPLFYNTALKEIGPKGALPRTALKEIRP